MNKHQHIKMIASAVALLAWVAPGSASAAENWFDTSNEAYNPSWYVAPSINAIDPDNKFIGHRGEGVGLRLGIPVSPSWDIQFGPTFSRARDDSTYYRQHNLGVDAVYFFSRQSFRPLLLVGVGAEYDRLNLPGFQTGHTSPYVTAGVGFQYAFDDQLGMQLDYRRSHAYLRGNDFNFSRANTNILTLGMTFALDKAPAPPVAQAAPEPAPVVTPPPPPPRMVEAPVPPPPPPRFERYTLASTDLFNFDSAELSASQPKLDEIADAMNRNTEVKDVDVTGYTDRLGSEKYNMALSQRRADAVKNYLINRGVAANRLTAVAKGESNPVVECHDKKRVDLIKCLEPNRRVEVEQITVERRMP